MLILFVLAIVFRQRERAPESLFKSIRVKRRREKLMKLHSRRWATANERKDWLADWIRKSEDIRKREKSEEIIRSERVDAAAAVVVVVVARVLDVKKEMLFNLIQVRNEWRRWEYKHAHLSQSMETKRRHNELGSYAFSLTHQWRFSSVSIRIAMTPARYRYMREKKGGRTENRMGQHVLVIDRA